MRRGFAAILLLVLAGSLVILAGSIYLKQQNKTFSGTTTPASQMTPASSYSPKISSTPNPSTSAKVDETANWKTFTFSNNIFSFKYPQDFYVKNPEAGNGHWINFFKNGSKEILTTNSTLGTEAIRLILYDGVELKNLKTDKEPVINIEGKQAVKHDNGSVDIQIKKISASNEEILHLEFRKEILPNLDQILSTFKFLD